VVAVEDFSRLVSGVYDAAITPHRWVDAIRGIQLQLGASGAVFTVGDGGDRVLRAATSLPAEATSSYQEYYHRLDNELRCVEQGPIGIVRCSTELVDPPRDPEFYSDWMQPSELADGIFVRLTAALHPVCLVVAFPRRLDSLGDADGVRMLTALVPHLQQAVRPRFKFDEATGSAADLGAAFQRHRHGVFIVGPDCVVLETNSAAEQMLCSQDGLAFTAGQLVALGARDSGTLRGVVHFAVAGDRSGIRSGGTLLCERPSGKRAYIVHVLPLRHSAHREDLVPESSTAMIVVIDPESDPEPPMLLLRRLYQLTQTEADVAVRIARGADVKQIASEMCVSITTVRTHLQHIFGKTDTHRQAELIRLLLALSP
jgi:DNA-binding CsgD family transcriptional regulator